MSTGDLMDLIKVKDQLTEMAVYLPQPHRDHVALLIEAIDGGAHPQAVRAFLRPTRFRKARELACPR